MRVGFIFVLVLVTVVLITGCGTNDSQVDGPTIIGEVVETFTYDSENVTIRGDFTEHNITSGDTVVLHLRESKIIGKKGEELTLEDVNENDKIEVLLPEIISLSDEDPVIIDRVIQIKIIDY
ncbi:hypothetical protein ACERII_19300 [Evansella sp. AB-rgal1]|uniref:hypothetical protein n=1 Tax=Evansella sp. AB-rgal1 TaxID=3242696 RepID=UPI00359EA189